MRVLFIALFLIILTDPLFCQYNLAIGEWRSHLPQQFGREVTQSPEKIIYANLWNLIIIDKEDLSADFLSKVEGLSDIGIQKIAYDHSNQQLIIAYTNSNIDFVRENGSIINIPNIKENSNITGDKTIYDIYISDVGLIYLATGFGVIEFDGQNYNFGSTVFMNLRVNDLVEHEGYLYAATQEGLYRVLITATINFSDFTQWEFLSGDNTYGLPILQETVAISSFNENLFVGLEREVYQMAVDQASFEIFFTTQQDNLKITFLKAYTNLLAIGYDDDQFESHVEYFDNNGILMTQGNQCSNRTKGVEIDEVGRVWYADEFNNIRYAESIESNCKTLNYNSPYYHTVSDIDIKESVVMACDGGVTDNFQYLFSRQGFYIQEEGQWTNYNEFLNPAIGQNDLLSFFRIKAHPVENKVYVGSYWGGLLELDRSEPNQYKVYSQENSSIKGTLGDEARERISGIAFDDQQNLWVTAYGAPRPLNVMTPEGVWVNFSVISPRELSNITIDQYGYKWFPVQGGSGGVLIYDSGDDIMSPADDRQRFLNTSNSELTTNVVNVITEDLDGAIWVGTAEGPVIFDCGNDPFEEDCQGVRKKVLQDSIAAFLLADQDIRAIEIDGANQKWLGTRNGLFVQSPDGEEQILRFTKDNSPLFDNFITAMAYDGNSGQMYIATNKGMMSYQTNTTVGARRHIAKDVIVYPNPVQPDYTGPIAIRGLTQNAEVKITDINGNLIYQTNALGGQAIWYGEDYSGKNVASGVYLIFSSNATTSGNPDTFVAKVLLLK
jgi:hypothetical protein